MKKTLVIIALIIAACLAINTSMAAGWVVPGNSGSGSSSRNGAGYGLDAKLVKDLATRSGPSTEYTGCGYYTMKGTTVRAVAVAYDNGGVQWVVVEFAYGGSTRRAYTGADELDLTISQLYQLPEEDMTSYIGYGTITANSNPKWGPGNWYATYTDRILKKGARVAVIRQENGFYMVECYHTDGKILRCWISTGDVRLD